MLNCRWVLLKKFEEAVAYQAVRVSSLDVDRRYEIRSAEKVITKFGPSVALEMKESPVNIVKVFVPKRYSDCFSEDDIAHINNQRVKLYLVHKGTCSIRLKHCLLKSLCVCVCFVEEDNSVVDKLLHRAIYGRNLNVQVHQHFGFRLHFCWNTLHEHKRRCIERQY